MMMYISYKLVKAALTLTATVFLFISAVQGVCDSPQSIEHTTNDGGGLTTFAEGHILTFRCDPGYGKEGSGRALCRQGSWVGPTIACTTRSCGDPGYVMHGSRDSEVFTFGGQINFSCDSGYMLTGSSWLVCQADGTWSDPAPACNPVECPPLAPPADGSIFPSTEREFGTRVRITCDDDFELTGSATRECQADRTWSGEEAVCNEVGCKKPHLQDGEIEESNIQIGDVIYFICFDNATIEGSSSATCTAKDTWNNPVPKCWRMCVVPEIEHGIPVLPTGEQALSGDGMVQNNTQLFFQCEVGFHLDNKDPARCKNGTLDHISMCIEDITTAATTTTTAAPTDDNKKATKPPGSGSATAMSLSWTLWWLGCAHVTLALSLWLERLAVLVNL